VQEELFVLNSSTQFLRRNQKSLDRFELQATIRVAYYITLVLVTALCTACPEDYVASYPVVLLKLGRLKEAV